MTRNRAIARAERYFDDGRFLEDLSRRVAIPTESQNPDRGAELGRYLNEEMSESLERLGFQCRIFPNPDGKHGPFLIAERIEAADLPTVFTYAHGDVIRGQEGSWRAGIEPWKVRVEGERIYGRLVEDRFYLRVTGRGVRPQDLRAAVEVFGQETLAQFAAGS